jgi:hypothetical protein
MTFDRLVEDYPAWWIDFLGEHNHVGGFEATKWLADHAGLRPGQRMLDCGAFVGAAARWLAVERGARAVALDINADFLRAGREIDAEERVEWVAGTNARLPFRDRTFASVWCLDSQLAPREMSRVAAPRATLCLCCEVPVDSRGGVEAFIDEWAELGWEMRAHRPMTLEAAQQWRQAEAALVRQRPRYEARYGTRGYLAQLDLLATMVRAYERGGQGHGLFVFTRG